MVLGNPDFLFMPLRVPFGGRKASGWILERHGDTWVERMELSSTAGTGRHIMTRSPLVELDNGGTLGPWGFLRLGHQMTFSVKKPLQPLNILGRHGVEFKGNEGCLRFRGHDLEASDCADSADFLS